MNFPDIKFTGMGERVEGEGRTLKTPLKADPRLRTAGAGCRGLKPSENSNRPPFPSHSSSSAPAAGTACASSV